jgi:hypothetical protein
MREGTATEFQERRNRPGVEIRRFFGKRYTTISVSYLGKIIAEYTEILSRGKRQSISYSVTDE